MMSVLEWVKYGGVFDKPWVQNIYALGLFLGINGVLGLVCLLPLLHQQKTLSILLRDAKTTHEQETVLLTQKQDWQTRFETWMEKSPTSAHCEWIENAQVDKTTISFHELQLCLDEWVSRHEKPITEITLYRQASARTLEIIHD